jgi:hypothetical protein
MKQRVRLADQPTFRTWLSPYYGCLVEILTENIHPDTSGDETRSAGQSSKSW